MPGSSVWDNIKNPRGNSYPFSLSSYYVGNNAPNVPGARKVATLTALASIMVSGDVAYIGPGTYDEAAVVTFPATLSNITLIGIGGRHAAKIKPTTASQSGMIIHGDDVTIINLDIAGTSTSSAAALTVTGARFNAYGCKFRDALTQLVLGPGTAAQVTAGTKGTAALATFEDCVFASGTNGVVLTATDYGAIARARFINCFFCALTAAAFEEAGGTVSARFTNLGIEGCTFERASDGTAPTKYVSLNDDNGNTGYVAGCRFTTALNSGLNLVSTKLLWAGNFHPAGLSTTQPS